MSGVAFMVRPVKPKAYCHGVMSAASRATQTRYTRGRIVKVSVAERRLEETDRRRGMRCQPDSPFGDHGHAGGIDFDEHSRGAVIGAHDKTGPVTDVHHRRSQDTRVRTRAAADGYRFDGAAGQR